MIMFRCSRMWLHRQSLLRSHKKTTESNKRLGSSRAAFPAVPDRFPGSIPPRLGRRRLRRLHIHIDLQRYNPAHMQGQLLPERAKRSATVRDQRRQL